MNPSDIIDKQIAELGDWRGAMLATIRRAIHEAEPGIVEEWKWMGTPTWSMNGVVAIANPHKDKVKVTFAQGAHLPDPDKLFNNGLGGSLWRAIDIHEGDTLRVAAFKRLFRAGVSYNVAQLKSKSKGRPPKRAKASPSAEAPTRSKRS
jgi:hypothetical protein